MSTQAPVAKAAVEPPTRPRILDYLCLCVGVALSAGLVDLLEVQVRSAPVDPEPFWRPTLLKNFPLLLFLPVGMVVFWPIFFATQWILGRRDGVTAGEWLLGFAWLGALVLGGWALWKATGRLPEALASDDFKKSVILGYILTMIALALLAALILLIGVVMRTGKPWTHTFSIAILFWPMIPLLLMWLLELKLE